MPVGQPSQTPAEEACIVKPFEQSWVTLTKREHIQLLIEARYWKTAHQRAVARERWLELQKQQLLAGLAQYRAQPRSELEQAQDLQRQSHRCRKHRSQPH